MLTLFLWEGSLLSVDTGLFVWILVTFFLFIFLISKFAWGPILGALNEREENIKSSLEAAEKAFAQARDVAAQNDKALRDAEVEAQKIRRAASEQAEALRADRMEKAKVEADKLLADARNVIETEKKLAMQELRKEVASLAILAAEKILVSEIDGAKNRKLVDDFVGKLTSKN